MQDTKKTQIRLIDEFNQWLQPNHTELYDLNEIVIERFLKSRQKPGGTRRGDTATVASPSASRTRRHPTGEKNSPLPLNDGLPRSTDAT
jgi:hypothetical protein